MWISDISIRRPVFATMVIMSFMVLGVVSMTRLGIDLFPEVNFPFVNISVVYPGASPEEVETLVTKPIEDAVAGINGVKRVQSSSTESVAMVGLELRLELKQTGTSLTGRMLVYEVRGEGIRWSPPPVEGLEGRVQLGGETRMELKVPPQPPYFITRLSAVLVEDALDGIFDESLIG